MSISNCQFFEYTPYVLVNSKKLLTLIEIRRQPLLNAVSPSSNAYLLSEAYIEKI